MNAITDTFDCRVESCTNDAKQNRGVYAFLCEEHIQLAKQRPRDVARRESLEEAISRGINLGHSDPLEIARGVISKHGEEWLAAELKAHSEEIVSEIARQWLGRQRRSATLPSVLQKSTDLKVKGEVMLAKIFIPGEGWKSLGECTAADLSAREKFYLRAASSMVRWASWCRDCIDAMQAQGVDQLGKLSGQLPELPEAETV